jgi:acyl-CoA synthetase (NDP forming)
MGGASVREGVQILKKNGIATYFSPAKMAKTAAALVSYNNFRKRQGRST